MFLMYVDESGDSGLINSPTRYYVLSGLVVHELRWRPVLEQLLQFRHRLRDQHGLKLREELHAAGLINDPGALVRIKRYDRLSIIRDFADALSGIADLNLISVVVDKEGKDSSYDVFESAWRVMLQQLDDAVSHQSLRGLVNTADRAMVFPDDMDQRRLRRLLRKLRFYNPVPNPEGTGYRNARMVHVTEDPIFRNSEDSYLIQAVDLCAFLLYQHIAPSAYMRKKSGQNYFDRVMPIVHPRAWVTDPRGILWL